MKLLLVFAACCLASVSARDQGCGSLELMKVKAQWIQVYGLTSVSRERFAHQLWDYMFERHPKAMEYFTRVRADNIYSPEFHAHAVRVFGGLDIAISLLDDEETLDAQLAHLRDQHNERGIESEYFDYFWEALAHAIPLNAKHFDKDAWQDCFNVIKAGISKDLTEE